MPVELQVTDAALQSMPPTQLPLPLPAQFELWTSTLLAQLNRADLIARQEVCIRITDSCESRALNARYRQQDKPTNVLSFPVELPQAVLLDASDEAMPLGDLVLSLPVIAAEASAQGKPLVEHLAHLVMHGTLHLLGYDHESDEAAERMESIEIAALAACGIDNPYHVRTTGADA